jgi:hypothetical protein
MLSAGKNKYFFSYTRRSGSQNRKYIYLEHGFDQLVTHVKSRKWMSKAAFSKFLVFYSPK